MKQVYEADPVPTWANDEVRWGPEGWVHADTGQPVRLRWPKPSGWGYADRRAHPWLFDGQRTPPRRWWDQLPARALAAWRAWAVGPLDGPAFARLPRLS